MVKSFIDNDLYKFTMMYAVLSNKDLCNLKVRYQFFNRNDVRFPEGFDLELKRRVQNMSNLKLTKDEKEFFMSKCQSYLPNWFFDFIEGYSYDPNEVFIFMENGNLKVKIEGYWWRTILWEVPLMAIISELYFEMTQKDYDFNNVSNRQARLENNIHKANLMVMNNLKVSEFGTRRRFSYENQKEVLGDLLNYGRKSIVGTSNVHLGFIYNINIHGSIAHEFFMVIAGLYGYITANRIVMDLWDNTFNSNGGTILTDTFTTDVFLKSYSLKYSKIFDCCRCDSGNPYEYIKKITNHYKQLGVNTNHKNIIFSDGINIDNAVDISNACIKENINCSFGIGTYLSNDLNFKALNIVIKVTQVLINDEWKNLVKISDNLGKCTGSKNEIELCKKILNISDIIYDKQQSGNEDDKPKLNEVY